MADINIAYEALKNADAAGDVEGAKRIADYIYSQRTPSHADQLKEVKFPLEIGQESFPKAMEQTLSDAPESEKRLAAVGKPAADIIESVKQMMGKPDVSSIKGWRQIGEESPKMELAGNVLSAALPGKGLGLAGKEGVLSKALSSVPGMAAAGGAVGGLQPTLGEEDRIKNVIEGAATSTLLAGAGKGIGSSVEKQALERERIGITQADKESKLRELKSAGFKTEAEPTMATAKGMKSGDPHAYVSGTGRVHGYWPHVLHFGESESQKMAHNESISQKLATEFLSSRDTKLKSGQPLKPSDFQALKTAKDTAGAYEAIKSVPGSISPSPKFDEEIKGLLSEVEKINKDFPGAVKMAGEDIPGTFRKVLSMWKKDGEGPSYRNALNYVQRLRDNATKSMLKWESGADPRAFYEMKDLADAQKKAANALEDLVEYNLNKPENKQYKGLMDEYRAARERYSQIYAVEEATNPVTGIVDAKKLNEARQRGANVKGKLGLIADAGELLPGTEISTKPGLTKRTAYGIVGSPQARKTMGILGAREVTEE